MFNSYTYRKFISGGYVIRDDTGFGASFGTSEGNGNGFGCGVPYWGRHDLVKTVGTVEFVKLPEGVTRKTGRARPISMGVNVELT